jgi:hypothetical protein
LNSAKPFECGENPRFCFTGQAVGAKSALPSWFSQKKTKAAVPSALKSLQQISHLQSPLGEFLFLGGSILFPIALT